MATVCAQNLRWREMSGMLRPVAGYAGGVVDGRMLIAGGSYWVDRQKCWSDEVQAFDPQTNSWCFLAPLPEPRSDAASATVGNTLYICGGVTGGEASKDVLAFHRQQWKRMPDLPAPRLYAAAVTSRGALYVLGGIAKVGDYQAMTNTFWRLDPDSEAWEELSPMPGSGRINHAMTEIDGTIYVFGGAAAGPQDVQNLKDVYCYDSAQNAWIQLPDLLVANRSWCAIQIENRALLLAGYTNDYSRAVYWYDPLSGLQPAGDLPHGLADIRFYRLGSLVIGAGGEAGPRIRGQWTLAARLPVSGKG